MSIDLYSTHELREMVEIAQPNAQFFVNVFFNPIVEFDREFITFDVMNERDTLAPFVSPCTMGKPRKKEGFETKSFKPPYVKPKDFMKPCDAIKRMPGEAIGGGLSQADKFATETNRLLREQARMIERRMEWMCAQVLINGKFTVSGDDVPEQEIDYGRALENEANVGDLAAAWTDPTAKVLNDLQNWSGVILDATGVGANQVVMDPKAFDLFVQNDQVKNLLEIRNGYQGDFNLSPAVASKNFYKGMIGGFNIWVYNDSYLDEAGDRQQIMPDYTVLVIANGEGGLDGYRAYGAIQDVNALEPAALFAKQWEQEDPSGICIMTQSAGIPIASRINATFKATVATAP